MRKKIYLSGPITGAENYKEKFEEAESIIYALAEKQCVHVDVFNPAILPEGFTYKEYIDMCIPILSMCDQIVMLDDWETSRGATLEKIYAETVGINLTYLRDAIYELQCNTTYTSDEAFERIKSILGDGESLSMNDDNEKKHEQFKEQLDTLKNIDASGLLEFLKRISDVWNHTATAPEITTDVIEDELIADYSGASRVCINFNFPNLEKTGVISMSTVVDNFDDVEEIEKGADL